MKTITQTLLAICIGLFPAICGAQATVMERGNSGVTFSAGALTIDEEQSLVVGVGLCIKTTFDIGVTHASIGGNSSSTISSGVHLRGSAVDLAAIFGYTEFGRGSNAEYAGAQLSVYPLRDFRQSLILSVRAAHVFGGSDISDGNLWGLGADVKLLSGQSAQLYGGLDHESLNQEYADTQSSTAVTVTVVIPGRKK